MSLSRPADQPRSLAAVLAFALVAVSGVWLTGGSAAAATPAVVLAPIVGVDGTPICDALDRDPDYTDVDCNDDGVSAYYGSDGTTAAFSVVLEKTPLTSTGNQPPLESTAFLVQLGVGGVHKASFGVDGKETGDKDHLYVICAGAATPHWTQNASEALADGTLTVRNDTGSSAGQAVRVTVYVPQAELVRCGITPTTSVAPFVGTTQAGPIGNINKDFFLGKDVDFAALNTDPHAVDDAIATTAGGGAQTVPVLANDSDDDRPAQTLTVTSLGTTGTLGTAALSPSGVVTYTPPATRPAGGTDSFTYTISDGRGGTATATVTATFTAGPVNRAPLAVADSTTATRGAGTQTVAVVGNDSDPDAGDTFSVTSVNSTGTLGQVSTTGGGVSYTPPAVGAGTETTDTFRYTITDAGGLTSTATVTVTLARGNRAPDAVADTDTAVRGAGAQEVPVTGNDSDPDNDPITVSAVNTSGTLGTVALSPAGVVTYTPPAIGAGAETTDTFSYTLRDGAGLTDTAVVTITLGRGNRPPLAVDDAATSVRGGSGQPVGVLTNDSDPDRDPLTVSTVDTAGTLGTVVLDAGVVTYTPPAVGGAQLTDTFGYTITDTGGLASSARVTVTLGRGNRAPVAADDSTSVVRGTGPAPVAVLGNDSDPDNDSFAVVSVDDAGTLGSVTVSGGTVTYTPPAVGGTQASDTFRYRIADTGGLQDEAVVSVLLGRGNRAPVAVDDSDDATRGGAGQVVPVRTNDTDPDGDALAVTSVNTTGTLGSVDLTAGVVTYTPPALGAGTQTSDTFRYTVSDPGGLTSTAVVTVTLARGNRPPLAVDDATSATRGETGAPVSVLVNDRDPDGDPISVTALDDAGTLGRVSLSGGVVTYAPPAAGAGTQITDSFRYTITDRGGLTSSALVTVSLGRGNRAPVAVNDTHAASTGGGAQTVGVTTNDSDPDGDTFGVTAVGTAGTLGTVTLVAGAVSYTPPAFGSSATADSFTYTITDAGGLTSTATVSVTLTRGNRPPLAADDSDTATRGGAATAVLVVPNDSDPDGDAFAVTAVGTAGTLGTVALSRAGVVTYTPPAVGAGTETTDTFTYTITDAFGLTSSAVVTVRLGRGNRPPLAVDDAATVTRGGAGQPVGVLTNDSDPDSDPLTVLAVDTAGTLGTVVLDAGVVTYTPPSVGGVGTTDTFRYTIGDGQGGTASALVTLTLGRGNRAPVAVDDSATASTGGDARPLTLVANDSDPDGDTFGITAVGTTGTAGTVSLVGGAVSYTPPGFGSTASSDTFTYTITDAGGLTSTATVTVTLTRGNRPPVAADDVLSVLEGVAATTVPVLANDRDADGDTLTVVSVTQPTAGTVTLVGGVVTYTPTPGRSGPDTFTYTVSDGKGGTDTGTVTVTVTARPAPVPPAPQPEPQPQPDPPVLPSDLSLDKSGPASARPGDVLTWRLAVLNKGPGTASGFTVRDVLPAGVQLSGLAGPGFTCDLPSVVCTYAGALPAGQTAVLTVTGQLAAGTTAGAVANTAEVGPVDATPADNTDTLVTSVVQPEPTPGRPDLVLDLAGPLAAVLPGSGLSYGIVVQNVGTAPATGITLTDVLPAGLRLVAVDGALKGLRSGLAAGALTCAADTVTCSYAGSLAPGASFRLTVDTLLDPAYGLSSVANTASVALAGDPTPENNTDTATTPVLLPIGEITDPDPVQEEELPIDGPTAAPAPTPIREETVDPISVPFTGAPADLLLGLGAGLSVLGLLLALTGRRRRTA